MVSKMRLQRNPNPQKHAREIWHSCLETSLTLLSLIKTCTYTQLHLCIHSHTHTHTHRHIHIHYTQMSTSLRKWNKLTQASLSETSWSHEELLFIRNKRKYKKSTEKCNQSLSVSFNVSPFFTGGMLLWLDILSNAPWSCNLTFIKL